MSQQVRGKIFNMGGIWGVATRPEARRQGYCRRVLTELLTAVRDSGAVFTTLYPFRESFYERLGYTTFPCPSKPASTRPIWPRCSKWTCPATWRRRLSARYTPLTTCFCSSYSGKRTAWPS